MTSLARRERAALADVAAELGPHAPTLCGDWTVDELLAHLIVRESSLLGAPGILVPALSSFTDREMDRVGAWDFADLVSKVRRPARLSPSNLAPLDSLINRVEFFIHHEDIRRAQPDWAPRELSTSDQDSLWQAAKMLGGQLVRQADVPVVLQRTDDGQALAVRKGENPVVVAGEPSEILLFCYGRDQMVAELSGPEESVTALRTADKGI